MRTSESQAPEPLPSNERQPLTLLELILLVAGVALGLWLVLKDVTQSISDGSTPDAEAWFLLDVGVLGGLSVVGPAVLLLELRRRRARWGPGKVFWFAHGASAWLLWPPVIYKRIQGKEFSDSMSGMCWAYGTPLMAIYVTVALLAGGWLRRGRRIRRSWREQFGLILNMAWACTGLYILYLFYDEDFGL